MLIINAFRDFADGLSRGFGLYFSERNEYVERTMLPSSRTRRSR
jgi:hypothetical protein